MISPDFLRNLDRFNLIISKRINSKYFGSRASDQQGRGSQLSDHRIYSQGDDFKLINWNIYAKTENLYIKRFDEERNLTVHVIIDQSASMNYGDPKKFEYASMLGVGFAYLSLKQNEKFRFATFSKDINVFQSKKTLHHVGTMIDYLENLELKGGSNFTKSMTNYKPSIRTKSLIIIISDFLFDPKVLEEGLLRLGNQEIKVIQLLDETEKNINISGNVKLKDIETEETMNTYISQRLISEYESSLQKHVSELRKVCLRMKADFYSINTKEPIFDSFYKMLV